MPPTLPHLPNTGYGASTMGADTRGNGALLSGALLGLLALAGGGVGALWRQSGPRALRQPCDQATRLAQSPS
jgi:hypothetical protein